MTANLQAAVNYSPCAEYPNDPYIGFCKQNPKLKVRAESEHLAWEWIKELIADFVDSEAEVDRVLKEFNDKWSVRAGL